MIVLGKSGEKFVVREREREKWKREKVKEKERIFQGKKNEKDQNHQLSLSQFFVSEEWPKYTLMEKNIYK